MAWVKLDDGYSTHPKIIQAAADGLALDVAGLGYAARHLTDGFIADGVLAGLYPPLKQPRRVAERLVKVGRWARDDEDAEDGGSTTTSNTTLRRKNRPKRRRKIRSAPRGHQRHAGIKNESPETSTMLTSMLKRIRLSMPRRMWNPIPRPVPSRPM